MMAAKHLGLWGEISDFTFQGLTPFFGHIWPQQTASTFGSSSSKKNFDRFYVSPGSGVKVFGQQSGFLLSYVCSFLSDQCKDLHHQVKQNKRSRSNIPVTGRGSVTGGRGGVACRQCKGWLAFQLHVSILLSSPFCELIMSTLLHTKNQDSRSRLDLGTTQIRFEHADARSKTINLISPIQIFVFTFHPDLEI